MDEDQKKGAHGIVETKMVKGVRVNKDDGESSTGKRASAADQEDAHDLTKDEIMKKLDKAGVEYTQSETKDELIKKLPK